MRLLIVLFTYSLRANVFCKFVGYNTPETFAYSDQQFLQDYSPGRNIAGMVFLPGGKAMDISFDKSDMMYIQVPNTEIIEKLESYKLVHLYRWQMCTITEGDEFYYSLTWLLGTGEPSIPGCQAVGVKRVFVS